MLTGDTIQFDTRRQRQFTILHIKQHIEFLRNIPVDQQLISLHQEVLPDDKLINNDIAVQLILVPSNPMTIQLNIPGGKICTLEAKPADSVFSLKSMIQGKTDIPAKKQRVFYGDFHLRDNHSLADYYIHRNSTISVLVLFVVTVVLPL